MSGWAKKIRQFGTVSTRSLAQAAEDLVPPKTHAIPSHMSKEQADICLNCSEKDCSFSDVQFRKCFKKYKEKKDG